MVFAYLISSPGSDLDGETFTIQDTDGKSADKRSAARLADIFKLASPERKAQTTCKPCGYYRSYEEYQREEAKGPWAKPAESGIALTDDDADAVVATLLADDIRAAGGS